MCAQKRYFKYYPNFRVLPKILFSFLLKVCFPPLKITIVKIVASKQIEGNRNLYRQKNRDKVPANKVSLFFQISRIPEFCNSDVKKTVY